ncbi:TRAP transporter substrate-binding protein [Pseudothermotoga thermarum]|uniref:Extracellular solute-binding protein, family 7 n=1 Tax=Pseudothermotoga thermarum DSM 5069 TaxID=688269 RepID=F7YYQ2_9THEM|nr:TRAP transporter substrate-binding protein [Pseudothermotoga thermarum]AEH51085.1 Extracellular solute-binding protein, family 7 [Pseudothermotoga thermarum DSM 5069]
MRKLLVILALYILIVATVIGQQIVLKAVSPFQKGHILVEAAEKFKELIETRTSGRITVEISAGQVSEEEANNLCASGAADLQFTGGRPVEVFAPEYFFVNAPFVIKDYEHFLRVWNGPIGEKAKSLIAEKGNMICLGTVYRGYRQFTSNKPITSLQDLQGLKLRLPVVPTWVKIWEALGTTPVTVPLTDLYNALKEKRAEASEGDLTQIESFKLYEVQSYLTLTNHLCGVGWVMMYKPTFDKLSKDDQKLVVDLMTEACNWATQRLKENESNIIERLKAKGMKVLTLDETVAQQLREKAKPAVEELFKTAWPVTTWDEVLKQ